MNLTTPPPSDRRRWRFGLRAALAALCLLTVSMGCQHLKSNHELSDEELAAAETLDSATRDRLLVQQQLGEVYRLIRAGRPVTAKARLDALRNQPYLQDEVALLDQEIERLLDRPSTMRQRGISADYALGEVDERLVLPDSYAKSRIITPQTDPYALPKGPMEELLNRKVTMSLQQADVKMLVETLDGIQGLNFIADDALEAQRSLTISVTDVPLREVLSYISRNMGLAFHLGENVIWITTAPDVGDNGPELVTRLFRLHRGYIPEAASGSGGGGGGGGFAADTSGGGGASEEELRTALQEFLESVPSRSPDAYFNIYRDRDIMVVRDTLENMRMIEQIIEAFDRPPVQVLVEARFLTISQNDLKQLGTSINELSFTAGNEANFDYASVLPAFGASVGGAPTLALSGILDRFSYDAVIQAVEQNGRSRTLSAPRITVLNNRQASLRRGENRFYFREFELESTGGETPIAQVVPSGDAEELELGITFTVRPSVGHDRKTIMLAINANIENFIEFVNLAEDISLPRTDENSINTIVAVNSGETLVMGGQLAMEDTDNHSQVPVAGNVPVVGWLFKKKDRSTSPEHLLIFVTATLIDPDGYLNVVPDTQSRAIPQP